MHTLIKEFTGSALLLVGALLPIVNPLGNAPIFLSLTRGLSAQGRARLSRSIAWNGLVLIVASVFIGTHVLSFFGISLPVVQVAGGLLVVTTGWTLLRRSDDPDGSGPFETCNEANFMRQAFYPLTLPLTVGPGSISVAITIGADRPQSGSWPAIVGLLVGAILVAVSIYLCNRFAEGIARVLGDRGMDVFLRLSSFVLLCIGVQIAWNGLSALLRSVR